MGKLVGLKRFIPLPPKHEELKRLRKLQAKYIESLDKDQLKALESHLIGPYESMEFGYTGGYGTEELAQRMDAIISGAPRMRDPMTVYRGSSRNRMIPENEYPLTTTIDPTHAETYAEGWAGDRGLFNEIEVPADAPALAIPDEKTLRRLTGELPPFGDEMEVLLPKSDLDLLKKYEHGEPWPTEPERFIEYERVRYKSPYKAEGGLV